MADQKGESLATASSIASLFLYGWDDTDDLKVPATLLGATAVVASRTELKAVDSTVQTVAILTEAGRAGVFALSAIDLSAQVAIDTREAVYIEADDGAFWVRQGQWFTHGAVASWFYETADGTDGYPSLQAGIDFALAVSVALQLGPETYKTSQRLVAGTITVASGKKLHIRGVGRTASVIQGAHSNAVLRLGDPAAAAFSGYVVLEDFGLENFLGSTPGAALEAFDIVRSTFTRMRFEGCTHGVYLNGGVALLFDDCDFDGNTTGITGDDFASAAGGGYPNLIHIRHSRIVNNTSRGVNFTAGRMLLLDNCNIEGNGTNGVPTDAGVRVASDVGSEGSLTYAPGVTMRNCWCEANAGAGAVVLLGGSNAVEDTYFVANANATYDIYIGGGAYRIEDTQHDTNKTTHITDEGTTSARNYINNARKADGTRANIIASAARCYQPDLGVPQSKQVATVQGSAVALTNNITTAQNVFAAANDNLAVDASTTYRFRAKISLNTGATSHTTSFGFGGSATFTSISYLAEATSSDANTLATPQKRRVETAAAAVLTAASTAVTTDIWIEGEMRINGAGTIIPQVTFSAGPTGTCEVAVDSFFELEPIGSNTVASVGPWA